MRKKVGYLLTFVLFAASIVAIPVLGRAVQLGGGEVTYLPVIMKPREFEIMPTSTTFTNVTDIANAGDGRLFITQRGGEIYVMQENGIKSLFLDLSDKVATNGSEVGMFAIAFHPDYASNGYFYVSYTESIDDENWYLNLSQFSVSSNPNVADKSSESLILKIKMTDQKHNGGGLEFNPIDGKLYMGVGDDGSGFNAQEESSYKGRLVQVSFDPQRVILNQRSPMVQLDDETFASGVVRVNRFTRGMRNPWRIAIDPVNGQMFVGDVGDLTYEEINLVPIDGQDFNFGWPCFEGPEQVLDFDSCNTTFDEPIYYYTTGCAITMGDVYRPNDDSSFAPEIIFGDGCDRSISGLHKTSSGWVAEPIGKLPDSEFGYLTTFGKDVNGTLYVGVLGGDVPLYELFIPHFSNR